MASGLPVVALRAGGPADLVQPGDTGYLAEPGDLDIFSNQILRLVQNEALRYQMGLTARVIAESRNWEAINRQISRILAEFAL